MSSPITKETLKKDAQGLREHITIMCYNHLELNGFNSTVLYKIKEDIEKYIEQLPNQVPARKEARR